MDESKYHKFKYEAMATAWEIMIAGKDRQFAGQAAAAAFAELDKLEGALSRFIDNSDISAINAAPAGLPVRVGEHTIECLKIAAQVCADTGGAFDVTIGPLMSVWRNPDRSPRQPSPEELAAARAKVGMHLVEINEADSTVTTKVAGMRIDLGGVGKGYGADIIARALDDWDIDRALINAGTSTVLAMEAPEGEKGWPIGVGGVGDEAEAPYILMLRKGSLSGSGVQVRGSHIMDPHTGKPVDGRPSAWSLCPTGAVADCLSTAFMIMTLDAIEQYVKKHPDTSALIAEKMDGQVKRSRYGQWPGLEAAS